MNEITLLKRMIAQERSGDVSQNAACAKIAKELDPVKWSAKYLVMLCGKNPPTPSDELRAAIRRIYRQREKKEKAKRYWLKIEAGSEDEKDDWVSRIPMARRQELFREEIYRLDAPFWKRAVDQIRKCFKK